MARSFKKTPVTSWTPCGERWGEQREKARAHRQYRVLVRRLLKSVLSADVEFPPSRIFGNPRLLPKDGKFRFRPSKNSPWMRK